jgi:hypothetical protein
MKTKLRTWLGAAAFGLLVVGLSGAAFAADKASATGKWKWSFERGGQTMETTLTLKQDGEKLTGAVTGRNNTETAITDGKVKDGEVSFKVTREREGQKFTMAYKGKVSEDVIKGTIESERDGQKNSREWEAKRVKEEKK